MRLLLVDDEFVVRKLVTTRLEQHGVHVTVATTVAAALRELGSNTFALVILDLTLPDGNGLEVLAALRSMGSDAHVIVLNGGLSESDRVGALDLGADDYVVKPFFVRELVARVLAVRRRREATAGNCLRFGAIAIDLTTRQVSNDDVVVDLTLKEFDLLAYLAARPRQVVTRGELLRAVWHSAPDWQTLATVTEHVRRVRAKLNQPPGEAALVRTVRGVGYRLEPPADGSFATHADNDPGQGALVVADERIVAADEAAVSILRLDRATEALGRRLEDFVAPQSLTAVGARGKAVRAGLAPRSQIVRLHSVGEKDVFVEVASTPTLWGDKPARLKTLRLSGDPAARLRHLATGVFSDVSDAVIVTDVDQHIRSWNHPAERLYGWPERDVLGRHIADVIPFVDDADGVIASMQALKETGRSYGQGRQAARDGSLVTVSATASMLCDDAGEPVAMVSVNRPVAKSIALRGSRAAYGASDIRRGLDDDEFEVFYQPVVALPDGRMTGVEALVRWNHQDRGLLTPGDFMRLIEDTEVVAELGRVVLGKVCNQAARWQGAGVELDVAVNVSSRELADVGFFDDVAGTIDASGCCPDAVWLEVTENTLVEDLDAAAAMLQRLAGLGVRIAIDDFGTGWASLTYLREFPVHAIKVDRSFVADVDRNPQDSAIVSSILSLGAELDLVVVAEGVETLVQQHALEALGCLRAQGFLYGRPTLADAVPVERARRRLRASARLPA